MNYYQNNKFHSILTRFCKYNYCKKCSSINFFFFIDLLTLQQLSQGGGHNLKHRGRQSGETPRAVIQYIKSIAPPPMLEEDPNPSTL